MTIDAIRLDARHGRRLRSKDHPPETEWDVPGGDIRKDRLWRHYRTSRVFEQPMARRALAFAELAHAGQVRKYTGSPYINHPMEMVMMLHIGVGCRKRGLPPVLTAIALLHDTIEDCGVTYDQLVAEFGELVAVGVDAMTEDKREGENRAARKARMRDHFATAPWIVQNVKAVDLLSNGRSIIKHDARFAAVFMREARELMAAMPDVAFPMAMSFDNMSDLYDRAIGAKTEMEAFYIKGLPDGLR